MQTNSQYETLRSWYLAKLRKSAIEVQVSGQLTPSALIAADREVIERLIAERGETGSLRVVSKNSGRSSLNRVLFIWIYLIAAMLISLFFYSLADWAMFFEVLFSAMNPAKLLGNSDTVPNIFIQVLTQTVFYLYPAIAIPLAMFIKKEDQ